MLAPAHPHDATRRFPMPIAGAVPRIIARSVSRYVAASLFGGAPTGAAALLGDEDEGLAIDFTSNKRFGPTGFYGDALIKDLGTPANDYNTSPVTAASSLLTYTSPSPKMTLGPDGTYRYQAHNLYLNSASPADQAITVVSGASYAVTITGSVSVTASGAATGTWTAGTNTFTAATTTLTLGSTSGSGTVHVYRTPADTTYLATAGSARFDLPFEWNTSGVLQGIRVEPAATNLLLYNTSFQSTQWSVSSTTVTAASAVAPDGTTTGVELREAAASTFHFIQQTAATAGLSITAATDYTLSLYVKDGTRRYVQLAFDDGSSGPHSTYDLTSVAVTETGAHGTGTHTSSSIASVGNGWYRLTLTGQVGGSTGDRVLILLAPSATPGWAPSYAGSTSNYVYIWGAQLETGTVATSPIITYGATATRAADNISLATSAFPYNQPTGTIYCQFDASFPGGNARFISLDNGVGARVLDCYYSTSTILTAYDGTGNLPNIGYTNNAQADYAACYATTDYAHVVNGGTVGTSSSATVNTAAKISVGQAGNATAQLNGILKKIAYWPRRVSDADLQTLTSTGALP